MRPSVHSQGGGLVRGNTDRGMWYPFAAPALREIAYNTQAEDVLAEIGEGK